MSNSSFVHLHNHTEYSMLDGLAKMKDLAKEAKRQGMPAVGMTDHGNMFGADEFYRTMTDAGVKPIIGIEAYMAPESRLNKTQVFWGNPDQRGDDVSSKGAYLHQTMLAATAEGVRNLFTLSSLASYEGYYKHPRMDREIVAEHASGIIATTGCPSGDVQTRLRLRQFDEALETAATWQDIYGKENFFLELMDHDLEIERRVRDDLLEIGRRLDLPHLVTNDCHYVHAEDAPIQDALLCVSQKDVTLDTPTKENGGSRFAFQGNSYYLKSASEMRDYWDGISKNGCDNTLLIAERVEDYGNIWENHPYDRMPLFDVPEGYTPATWLHKEVMDGLRERFGWRDIPQEYLDRAEYEIKVISDKGYPSYFLVVADLISHAREVGIRVGPGRGSAAGALVAYALRITNIDPIEHGLLFERFLNPERPSAPDIDIDFDDQRRGEMIQYASDTWGEDKVAQVITFGTIKTKQALKDSARVQFGQPGFQKAENITRGLPAKEISLAGIMDDSNPLYNEAKEARELINSDFDSKKIYDTALGLEGTIRQAGVHACAVIMASVPLMDCIPLWKRQDDGALITGWPYPACEAIGLLKMDFLGLRNLTVIGDTINNIKNNRGIDFDVEGLPLDDTDTYKLMGRGDTLGVFQFESVGMQELLKKMTPTHFNDIVAATALYRPGPMEMNAHMKYADRKNGRAPLEPIHPELEEPLRDILSETYGLIVYQEQIMQISQKVANYTAGQADSFRKAMGKKKAEVLEQEFGNFSEGMKSNGLSDEAIQTLWDTILPFAGYAFNKSHAAAYGVVSYWTAYLKSHFPAEYMAALLTSVAKDKTKTAVYLTDSRRLGIQVLSPDVNESTETFQPAGKDIRFGLGTVRGIGSDIIQGIVDARTEKGNFRSFTDFLTKVDAKVCKKSAVENLVKAGAFDSLDHSRKGLYSIHDRAIDAVLPVKKAQLNNQEDLFSLSPVEEDPALNIAVPEEEWEMKDKLALEKEMLGMYVSSHPLDNVAEALEAYSKTSFIDVVNDDLDPGQNTITVAGILTKVDKRTARSGNTYAIVTIEDPHGVSIEMMAFAKTLEAYGLDLYPDNIVVLTASVKRDEDRVSYFINGVDIPDLSFVPGKGIPVKLSIKEHQATEENIARLRSILEQYPGSSDVFLTLRSENEPDRTFLLDSSLRVDKGIDLISSLNVGAWEGIFE